MLTRMARLLTRMARMLTRMTRMARMLTRMTRWLAGSHIIHTPLLPDKWNTAHNSALCTTGETACRVFRALELQSSCPEFNPLHNSCSW